MDLKTYDKAKNLISDITKLALVQSAIKDNYKDAGERCLWEVVSKYKDRILPLLSEIEKNLKEKLDKL